MVEQQWKDLKVSEEERRDKEKAAVHEAGHATVAVAKGFGARPWLYRNTSQQSEEKMWLGKCDILDLRGRPGLAGLSDPTYAVAGMVAEYLDDVPAISGWEIMDEWEISGATRVGLSPTDMKLVPKNWRARKAAVEEALTILRDQKPLFDRIVSQLLEHECVTDGMISEWSRELFVKHPVKPPRQARRKK